MPPENIRKFIIILGLSISTISEGYIFGHLTGMTGDLMSKDSDVHLSTNEVSWITSALQVSGVAGFMVAAMISERLGRSRTITILTLPIIVHWIMLYYAKNFIQFLIAKIIVGVGFGGVFTMVLIATAEYINPDHRASCVSLMSSIGPTVGGTISVLLCTIVHWRVVALTGIIPTTLAALLPCFWIESPSWLASKGRFEECEEAFKMLNGNGPAALAELQLLISVEKRNQKQSSNRTFHISRKLLTAAKQKYFWKLALLSFVVNALNCACGKIQMSVYLIPIFKKTIGRADFLIMNTFTSCQFLGCCLAPLVFKKFNLRTLMLPSGILCNICLIVLSVCIYINSESVYIPWVNGLMIMLYTITMNTVTFPMTQILGSEIYPLDIKCYCVFIFGIVGVSWMFMTIKWTPYMFETIGYHGVFMSNVIIMSLCYLYLWFFMPETKGKTLQEIELHFKNEKCDNVLLDLKTEDHEC